MPYKVNANNRFYYHPVPATVKYADDPDGNPIQPVFRWPQWAIDLANELLRRGITPTVAILTVRKEVIKNVQLS